MISDYVPAYDKKYILAIWALFMIGKKKNKINIK